MQFNLTVSKEKIFAIVNQQLMNKAWSFSAFTGSFQLENIEDIEVQKDEVVLTASGILLLSKNTQPQFTRNIGFAIFFKIEKIGKKWIPQIRSVEKLKWYKKNHPVPDSSSSNWLVQRFVDSFIRKLNNELVEEPNSDLSNGLNRPLIPINKELEQRANMNLALDGIRIVCISDKEEDIEISLKTEASIVDEVRVVSSEMFIDIDEDKIHETSQWSLKLGDDRMLEILRKNLQKIKWGEERFLSPEYHELLFSPNSISIEVSIPQYFNIRGWLMLSLKVVEDGVRIDGFELRPPENRSKNLIRRMAYRQLEKVLRKKILEQSFYSYEYLSLVIKELIDEQMNHLPAILINEWEINLISLEEKVLRVVFGGKITAEMT